MKKVVVIGGGFAGLTAARRLTRASPEVGVTLIDQKETTDFLPMLPDIVGRGIAPASLSYSLEDMAQECSFRFMKAPVTALDIESKEITTGSGKLTYDYLLIASGSETNFYGNENVRQQAYTLDSVEDAKRIAAALKKNEYQHYVVGGGGYTGIEVATNLKAFLDRHKRSGEIVIVERAPSILGPLPEWMKQYVLVNLKALDIEVLVNSAIDKLEPAKAYLAGGKVLDNALVIWAAGVKAAPFIQSLTVEKNQQGRIKVDAYLRLNDTCFVAGDASLVAERSGFLRMAVQFALAQGACAAANIRRSIKGLPLAAFRPVDFGYIIPMANNKSCGRVLGVNLKGKVPTLLHFFMCIYRSWGAKNQREILQNLIGGAR